MVLKNSRVVDMNKLNDMKSIVLDNFSGDIRKIKNYEKLLQRLDSAQNGGQLEDIAAEIQVGVHHIRKNHSVNYEPDGFSKPPEYEITSDRRFFVEVKCVREDREMTRQKSVADDISKRLERIKRPYLIYLTVNYSMIKLDQTKEIAELIEDAFNKFNGQNIIGVKFYRTLKSGEEIEFDVVKITSEPNCRKIGDIFSFGDITENIIDQIKLANKKDIPNDKPFIVIVKLPDHADEIEARGGTRGLPGFRLYIDRSSREVIAQRPIASDRILGLVDHFRKISAVISYQHEFVEENAWFDINENATCPVDEEFITTNYFKCRRI